MAVTDIILSNYIVINNNAKNYDFIASISAVNDENLISPTFLLINNAEGAFLVSGSSLLINDYSELTTVFSDTREITLSVSGYGFSKNILLQISASNCFDYVDNSIIGCCTTSGSILPNCEEGYGFFDPLSSCYEGEIQLYQNLLEGAINSAPIQAVFYAIKYNTNYDTILGEDPTRKIIRKFNFNGYAPDLPEEAQTFSTMFGGIQGMDKFNLYVSKKHFATQSRKDYLGNPNVYPEYVPHGGEYVLLKYNSKFYEITNVGEQAEMYLQHKHTYLLTMKVYEDDKPAFIPQTSASMVNDIIKVSNIEKDIFNVSEVIDREKTRILYTSTSNEIKQNDPFVGW